MDVARSRSSRTLAAVTVCLALAAPGAGRDRQAPEAALALETLFERGPIFLDRNGDRVVDFVHARIVVGEQPSPAEVVAAANVAARLGFETMAIDLPLPVSDDGGPTRIVVGRRGLARVGLGLADAGIDAGAAGTGVVTIAEIGGQPAVVIAGVDAAGTRAAARLFAGRLPHVWEPKGPTLADVAADLRAFLKDDGIVPGGTTVTEVRVTSDHDAIDRLGVRVRLDSSDDGTHAARALTRLAAARPSVEAGLPAGEHQPPLLSYPGARIVRVELEVAGAATTFVDVPRARAAEDGPRGRRPGSSAKRKLDLSSVYTNEGFLGDANRDLIPDRTDVLLVPFGEGIDGVIDLAARIGLEATGLSIPLACTPGDIEKPEQAPTLVLIGTAHPLIDTLVEAGKLTLPDLEPGQGLIRIVRPAFGSKSALVITGGDAAGVARAIRQVAERVPHIWARGEDRTTIGDVEDDLRRLLSGRSPAGQAATALYKLERIASELSARDLASATVTVYLDRPASGFERFLRRVATDTLHAPTLDVRVESLDVREARPIRVNGAPISTEFDIPSEVDEFWDTFRARVMPEVHPGQPVTVVARLSEPPALRARLERQAVAALVAAGAAPDRTTVTVLSAYKQGYSWLYEVVRPALAELPVDRLVIRFAEIGPPPGWTQQAMFTPTRWLLELFPIDEVLARDLGLSLDQITFQQMPIGAPAYEVIARDRFDHELLRETFAPTFVVRPYFDRFPDYEQVRVTTGWLTATIGHRTLVDTRIVTDPERFWDRFQAATLPALYDYVMALYHGKPRAADAPHFGELRVELTLSEPEYRLGIDQEQIAPMEALHEEIYFATLHFFDVLGRYTRGQPLTYPGRVIPITRAKSDGTPGRARITFTGFGSSRPAVVVEYRERGGRTGRVRRDIPKVALERPAALAALVRNGRDGLERLDLRVKVDSEHDRWAQLVKRTRVERVDAEIMSADEVLAVAANLERLRDAGLYEDELAYHDLGALQISAGWTHAIGSANERTAWLGHGGRPAPFPDVKALLRAATPSAGGHAPLVQWETPIPPAEAYATLAAMAEYPEATVYKVGESYLGRDIWAMDLMSPIVASHWSHAKATTFKPTVIYSARQHANEVSSTSHVLKLAELLLTTPAFKKQLERVNVVIHPITNADGAQLAYDLSQETPDYMLHAGYLGALGVDVSAAQWDADPIYPESSIRPRLWRTWLPDIFLNPHGYPSHEWVQLFSEYAGWVRNRVTQSRDWWGMRGWFMPGFSYLDDPRYPRHKAAAFAIRDRITASINAVPELRALNARAYDRYRRYGFAHDDENFKLDFTNDVLIYTAIKGARASPRGRSFMARNPRVTIWGGSTEAPDETARGDWMKLVATAGLQWDKALLRYLADGHHVVERSADEFFGGVRLSMFRPRPPKDGGS